MGAVVASSVHLNGPTTGLGHGLHSNSGIAFVAWAAVYHAGYSDFRSDKLRKPATGDLVWSVPTIATLNPVGAPIAHGGLHVGAVVHNYVTDLFLPPH